MICGVDEAGRGPILGPLVICALAVETDAKLIQLGVKDSKKLTAKKREELAAKIRQVCRVEIVEISAEEIDAMREEITLNELEARVFATIIERLSPKMAYMDAADANEEQFDRMVRSELKCGAETCSQHKADEQFPVVSAASIIAKVTRDARMAEIEKEIGEPVGSGYTSDPHTVSFLKSWVARQGSLPPHTRKSWDTAKNIMMLNGLRRLDSFEG